MLIFSLDEHIGAEALMSADKSREDLSHSIAQLMPNIIQGVHIGFLAHKKLTHTQFFVMVAIHSQGLPTMRALSDNMQVSMPTMSGIVERLVQGGYVKRVNHPDDRRQVLIELTPQGRRLITEFQQAAGRRWQQVLLTLNQQEIQSFTKIVMKLRQNLQRK